MCGRYSLSKRMEDVAARFQADSFREIRIPPRFNIPPSSDVPTIVAEGKGRRLGLMNWGVYRQWTPAKPPVFITNLRAEKLEKGAFKTPLASRRCLVVADGFYEWKTVDGKKWPVRFTLKDDGLFAFAGIYDEPQEDRGPASRTFTIFTTEPNAVVAPVHDRMPVILRPELEAAWLDPALTDVEEVIGMLAPYPAEAMRSWDVSPELNSPKNDYPDIVKPVPPVIERDLFS